MSWLASGPARPGSRLRTGLLCAALVAGSAANAQGQEDFRSADLDRPLRVEDAGAIEFRAWEIEFGSRGFLAEGSERGLEGIFELKAGLFRNAQVGIEIEGALESAGGGGGTQSGVESIGAHVVYGFARETPSSPALALRLDVASPGAGALGNEEGQVGLKGMVTRSLGRLRLHGNGGYVVASDVDGGDYWRLGVGTDYPIGLFSRAILADVYAELPTAVGLDTRVWVDVGSRFQISNVTVIDVGLATRVDAWRNDQANLEITIGLSRVFGFAPDVPPYPDPSLR